MSRYLSLLAAWCLLLPATILTAQQFTWKKLSVPAGQAAALVVAPGDRVYAHIGERTYRSTDHGATWTPRGELPGEDVTVFRVGPEGALYAGTFSRLYRSTDEGATWVRFDSFVGHVWDIAFNGKGHIVLGTEESYLVRSTDKGATWKPHGAGTMGVAVWSVGVDAEDRLFAGCQGEGVFRSTDDGGTWSGALPGYVIYGLATARNGDLFAGVSEDGIFRSTDHGATWKKTALVEQSGLAAVTMGRNIVFNEAGHIFASGFSMGDQGAVNAVYRSTDGGTTWSRFGDRFGGQDFIVAMDIDRAGVLYVATLSGVFSASDGVSSVEDVEGSGDMLRLAGGSPVGDDVVFAVTLPTRRGVTLRVVDMAGREVARPYAGELEAGAHRIPWNASDIAPGSYICQLLAGEATHVTKVLVVR